MKQLAMVLVMSVVCSLASAEEQQEGRRPRPPHLNLTEEQRTCLEGKLGKPGDGERPSREAMEAAFSACGVEKPERMPGKGHRRHQSEDEGTSTEQ